MTNTPTRKAKSDTYTYSWFLPAPGANPATGPAPSLEEAPAESPGQAEELSFQDRAQDRSFGFPGGLSLSGVLSSDTGKVRLLGLLGWSGVAGAGMALTVARSGSSLQTGAIAGVWVAVAAVIWILPAKLKR